MAKGKYLQSFWNGVTHRLGAAVQDKIVNLENMDEEKCDFIYSAWVYQDQKTNKTNPT